MLVVLERPSKYHKETKDTNYDNLWKKVIMDLFEDFLYFFLPAFHEQVDFSRPIEFIQQELFKKIIIDRKGRKMADQIAKVYLKNGKEQWVNEVIKRTIGKVNRRNSHENSRGG